MSLYVDSSALLKRYVEEPESAECVQYMGADPIWITARLTTVEVRRNLARLLKGANLAAAHAAFADDWSRFHVVEIDQTTCEHAAQIAETTGCRSLDAVHLAAARRVRGAGVLTVLTYDIRQAQVARSLGMTVAGA